MTSVPNRLRVVERRTHDGPRARRDHGCRRGAHRRAARRGACGRVARRRPQGPPRPPAERAMSSPEPLEEARGAPAGATRRRRPRANRLGVVSSSQCFGGGAVRPMAPGARAPTRSEIGGAVTIPARETDALRRDLDGPLLLPGEAGYDERLGFNRLLDPHPALVVGARGPGDVAAAVRFAAAHGLPVAVKGTGHGATLSCDGGVLVTTERMAGVTVDAKARTARVGAGTVWRQVVQKAAQAGLAPLSGSAPGVGAVGYTTGGGLPLMGRTFGWAADRVRSLQVVTADGTLHRASPVEDAELHWAVRGGKGNFGVVTELEIELVRVMWLFGGALIFRADQGAALVAPLRAMGERILDGVGPMPYTGAWAIHMDPTDPLPSTDTTAVLDELGPATTDALLRAAVRGSQTPLLMVEVRHLGGALARPPRKPSAVGHRDAAFNLYAVTPVFPGMEMTVAAGLRSLRDTIAPFDSGKVLLNFLGPGDTDPARVRCAFEPETYRRLAAIKALHDPDNLFRLNHNIPPEGP